MPVAVKQFFALPVFADDEKNRTLILLKLMLLVIMIGVVLYTVCLPFFSPGPNFTIWQIIILFVLPSGIYGLLRIGQLRLASITLVGWMWIFTTFFILADAAGAVSFNPYISCIFLVGLLLGERWGLICAVVSIFTSLSILWADIHHLLPPAPFVHAPMVSAVAQLLACIIAAILLHFIAKNLNDVIVRARHNEQALTIVNQALRARTQELEWKEVALQASEARYRQLVAPLNTQSIQLRALYRRLAETQEIERKLLAHELHDRVGQNLTVLGLNLNIVRTHLQADSVDFKLFRTTLEDAIGLVKQTDELIRDVMVDLRPAMLDEHGLRAALKWYSALLARRTELQIYLHDEADFPRLPESIELALFRIAQEVFMNVIKHAQATEIHIILKAEATHISLTIADNGCGFCPSPLNGDGKQNGNDKQSWGLLTMRERAAAVGGSCSIESKPNEGTRVTVELTR